MFVFTLSSRLAPGPSEHSGFERRFGFYGVVAHHKSDPFFSVGIRSRI